MKKPDCAWDLADLDSVPKNGVKVMSTFACGGGSSMGYKRAGCTIVAANDIDPEMAWHYKKNLNPPLYYLCPIKDLLTKDLTEELFNLDILDGSPPCSTFSMAGSREKAWGKKKHFREGQAEQVLSDLFFDYLDLVNRLRPKVAIAENVKGMILGNAKGYTKMVMARFKEIGYRPQLFLLNAADCGVPQRRERVFFCAIRYDIQTPPLVLSPSHRWISLGYALSDLQNLTDEEKENTKAPPCYVAWYDRAKRGEYFCNVKRKHGQKESGFLGVRLDDGMPGPSFGAQHQHILHWATPRLLTYREWKRVGCFPDDYQAQNDNVGRYMIGMSVPPKMTEQVARAVIDQWILPSR